jgi:ferredoxin
MSVNIRFEPDGRSGLVAEGSYLWAAAKRLGVRLPAECEGHGECDTCAVLVLKGAALLSPPTESERERLTPEKLDAGERLACQVKIEYEGDLVVQPVPVSERTESSDEAADEIRKEFRSMPLEKKLATLSELEAVAMVETLNAILNFPFAVGWKLIGVMAGRGRSLNKQEREGRIPVEHRPSSEEPKSE